MARLKTLLKQSDALYDQYFDLAEQNFDDNQANMAARDDSGPTEEQKKRSKKMREIESKRSKIEAEIKKRRAAIKAGKKISKQKSDDAEKEKKAAERRKEKGTKLANNQGKRKLRSLSRRGGGGGGGMNLASRGRSRNLLQLMKDARGPLNE